MQNSPYGEYYMRSLNGHKGAPHQGFYPVEDQYKKRDAPGSGIRKFFLAVYILVSGIAAAAIILLVIFGNFSNVINN